MKWLRRRMSWLARTALHPQWLLGPRRPPGGIGDARGNVLDIGSADGWLRGHVDPAANYVALDFPATGQVLYGATPSVFADAQCLPFLDGTFDAVACLEVIEHVPAPDRVLGEVHRVLVPGGMAYFSMPFLYPVHDAPHDFSRFTADGWRRRAEEHGFLVHLLAKRTHSLRTAGLMACLAISGAISTRPGLLAVLMLPFAAASILLINCAAFVASLLVPDWDAMGTGYDVVLVKR